MLERTYPLGVATHIAATPRCLRAHASSSSRDGLRGDVVRLRHTPDTHQLGVKDCETVNNIQHTIRIEHM